ncbi:MAG: M24 family metallopeptidase [Rickettsiaceae bacterium]|nr:M24 family metallopeptidase [Rickettsiaceae bacterium]
MNELSIEKIRNKFKDYNIQGYLVSSSDEFMSEYPNDFFQRLEHLTNFSCSNGYLLITNDENIFFTDARYTHAAKLFFGEKAIVIDLKSIKDFNFDQHISSGAKIGYNPSIFNEQSVSLFNKLDLKETIDLVDQIWHNRPPEPISNAFLYEIKYAGENSHSKIARLRSYIQGQSANSIFITSPCSICWLLNIRGNDSEFSPIILSYLYVDLEQVIIFSKKRKWPENFDKDLIVKDIEDIETFLEGISRPIIIPHDASIFLLSKIKKEFILSKDDPLIQMRSIKNNSEILGSQNAHIEDAVALIESFAWIIQNSNGKSEYEISIKLKEFRARSKLYIIDSFSPIVGFRENGAKIHYRPSPDESLIISREGLLLIDSGGHYYGGTTDVTRVLVIGNALDAQKQAYTRVLKGHIQLAMAKFPKNISGANLDILARKYLWDAGKDYGHGTGHGVGNALSVHEGPASISPYSSKHALKNGMILSNEPGYYEAGEYGIRIENLQFIKDANLSNFLEFEQLTLVPYSSDLIIKDLLSDDELSFIRTYYKKIKASLYNKLSDEARAYLDYEFKDYL